MKKVISIILLTVILVSCSDGNHTKRTVSETRFLSGISNDSLKIRTEYQLIKTIGDSVIEYEYLSKIDTTRNFKAHYNKSQSELILGFTGYKKEEDNRLINRDISNYGFDSYVHIKPEIDGMGPILFNKKYGILAIGNPLGPAAAFTDNKPEFNVVYRIFERLY
ncbi:hypothetical protein [Zobellia alginiliquefaciens]|uniref:hypothetical protein n=1 Tax=Zobellia alginiliquefaciens TaxID=3032586 RepID=UPI0023E3FE25|nr:hypothetical protein [Zobellia alginiliquefaciens]